MTWYIVDKKEYLGAIKEVGAAYRELIGRHYPAMAVVQVVALMEDAMKRFADKPAMRCAGQTLSYADIDRLSRDFAAYLQGNGFKADVLSGDVAQNKRLRLLKEFQAGELPILVTTDVASRGLHIPAVSHVFNYDLPQDAEDYVHRIGRTARAGAKGDAVSFACEEFAFSLPEIEKYIGHAIPKQHQYEGLLERDMKASAPREHRPRPAHPKGRSGGGHRSRPQRRR